MKLISKYNNLPIPARASLWFVVCSILQKGLALLTVPIFTRIMTTEQYGLYSTFVSWYGVTIIFTSLSLYYGVFNNAMVKFQSDRNAYISSMQGLCMTLTLGFFLVYLIFKDSLNRMVGMSTCLVVLLFVKLFFAPSMEFWLVRNRFEFKYKKVVFVTLTQAVVGTIVGIVAVYFSENKDIARIITWVLVDTLFCLVIFTIQQVKGHKIFIKEYWIYALGFNLPLIPHYLSGVILSQGDRIMIVSYCGPSDVAFYSVAYSIGILINIIISAVNASVTPWMYEKMKGGNFADIKKNMNLLCIGMLVIITALILFAPEALRIIAASEYEEAVYVIPPVATSTLFTFMYNLFANVEFYFGERKYVSIGSISAAVLNIGLNAIFIPIFGYIAAAYTTLFCYVIYGLSHLWFSKIVLKNNEIKNDAFDTKNIIIISLVSIIATVFSSMLYSFDYLRYVLIFILMFLLRKKTKSFCMNLKNRRISDKN